MRILECLEDIAWTAAHHLKLNLSKTELLFIKLMQLLVQALVISRLDYCNSLLAGRTAFVTKPLQRIQNTAGHLVFNLPKYSHGTPLFCGLHWHPFAARIPFKTMLLAFKAINGTVLVYLQTLVRPHAPAWALRSTTSAGWLVPPSLRSKPAQPSRKTLLCSGASVEERTPDQWGPLVKWMCTKGPI